MLFEFFFITKTIFSGAFQKNGSPHLDRLNDKFCWLLLEKSTQEKSQNPEVTICLHSHKVGILKDFKIHHKASVPEPLF